MEEFCLGDLFCKFDCRYGLGENDFELCSHVKPVRMKELADQLLAAEQSRERESDLFSTVQLYVDDPAFWAMCLDFKGNLQRHLPIWIRDEFVRTTKHQLLRLSGKRLKKCDQELFLERIEQLLAITEYKKIDCLEQDIKYWVFNLERVIQTESLI